MGFPDRVEVYDGGALEGAAGLRRAVRAYYGRRVRLEAWDGFEVVDRAEGQAWNHGGAVRVGNLDVNTAPRGLHCDVALTDLAERCATFVGDPASPEASYFFAHALTLFEMGLMGDVGEPYRFVLRSLEDDLLYHWGVGLLENCAESLVLRHEKRANILVLGGQARHLSSSWPRAMAETAVVSLVPNSWYADPQAALGGELGP